MTGEFAVALHALVYLRHKQTQVSSEQLAHNICTHPVRVRKVLSKLRRAGLVTTKQGTDGGYRIATSGSLTLCDILDALQARVVEGTWKPGSADMDCLVASGMADVLDALYDRLDEHCRQSLSRVTLADIEQQIFGQKRRTQSTREGNR